MHPDEREVNRNDLANLQSRVDYLKNPRHVPPSAQGNRTLVKTSKKKPKEIGIKTKPENERYDIILPLGLLNTVNMLPSCISHLMVRVCSASPIIVLPVI